MGPESNVTLLLLLVVKSQSKSKSKSNSNVNVMAKSNLVALTCLILVCNAPACAVLLPLASNSKLSSGPICANLHLFPNSKLYFCSHCAVGFPFFLPYGSVYPFP